MANVTEHNSEQERERDALENSGVDFFVQWDAVGVRNLLENPGELVELEERRWLNVVVVVGVEANQVWHLDVVRVAVFEGLEVGEDSIDVSDGDPHEAHQEAASLAVELI